MEWGAISPFKTFYGSRVVPPAGCFDHPMLDLSRVFDIGGRHSNEDCRCMGAVNHDPLLSLHTWPAGAEKLMRAYQSLLKNSRS